jgi:ketosteroid isomerase-like protein
MAGLGQSLSRPQGDVCARAPYRQRFVLEVVWKGIHSGPLDMPTGTISASNGALDMPSCQVFEIKDGKVATFTQYFDLLTMLRQIGAA